MEIWLGVANTQYTDDMIYHFITVTYEMLLIDAQNIQSIKIK